MSISLNDANRSQQLSSNYSLVQNPNPNHGFSDRGAHGRLDFCEVDTKRNSVVSAPEATVGVIGAGVADSGGYCESSKDVVERSSNGIQGSYDPMTGTLSPGQPVQSASRKNQAGNANYLLNFYYNPIPRQTPRALPPRRQHRLKPYNKDLFLQANYKFVVFDSGNYHIESMDPDKMLQWEDIICVKYTTPSPVQCPICLDTPLCPQITSCGHIYCFPCILRYLLMGKEDNRGDCWKKCPLCFMKVSPRDLCSIQIDNVKKFKVGDHVNFILLSRPKDSVVPQLRNQQEETGIQYSSDDINDLFSKFTLTSDFKWPIREGESELRNWLNKAESGFVDDLEKLPYVCAALEQLEERVKNWIDQSTITSSPPSNVSLSSNQKAINTPTKPDTSILEINGSPEKVISFDENSNSQSSRDVAEKDSYTFYQAVDGQHLILHPLNMKCLLHHYGSYDMLPPRLSGLIMEIETVTQSEATRKRYRYLSHFSLTTSIQLCEIDLGEILSSKSLAPFKDKIKKREKQRKLIARKEQFQKSKAEATSLHEMPVISYQNYPLKNVTFSADDFEALGSGGAAPSTSPPINNDKKKFSDVTRLGFAAAHDSPSLKPELSENGDASTSQGPRQTPTLSFASIMSTPKATAMPAAHATNGSGKKGKKPTKVLLSTAGGRRY